MSKSIEGDRLLLRESEAAELLGLCGKSVQNLADRGELRRVRIGRAVRYTPTDLKAFVDRKTSGQSAEVVSA